MNMKTNVNAQQGEDSQTISAATAFWYAALVVFTLFLVSVYIVLGIAEEIIDRNKARTPLGSGIVVENRFVPDNQSAAGTSFR
jgi:hypothetical protein